MKIIPYGRHSIDDCDIAAVVNVLKSDFLTQGPEIEKFEKSFAEYVDAKYAVAVCNGTAALHLAALALNVNATSRVITTPITFAASANCILYCGGSVDFVDIDPKTYLIDINQLNEKLHKSTGYSGVIPVDLAGYPTNCEQLRKVTSKFGMWILEDACHSPGAFFDDSKKNKVFSGSNLYSDISVFSFHPVKHIAAGEGGLITTNSEKIFTKLKTLRTHGIVRDAGLMHENHGPWYYEMQELGYNYRIPDILAALASSQIKKASSNLIKRREIAERYNAALNGVGDIVVPYVVDGVHHAYHLYVIRTKKRDALFSYLRESNIYPQVHYLPVHLHPYYRKLGFKLGDFPVAECYYREAMSLPMYPTLSENDQSFVIDKIKSFFRL